MSNEVNIKEFAERVERFCDFFLSTLTSTEKLTNDAAVVLKLKEDAAYLQSLSRESPLQQLDSFMRGFPIK